MSNVKKDIGLVVNGSGHSDAHSPSVTGVVGKGVGHSTRVKKSTMHTHRGVSEIENIRISLQGYSNIGEVAQKNSLSLTFVEGDTIYRTDYSSDKPVKVVVGSVRKRVAVKSRVIKLK
ncbi:MAG: hypothetical protein R3Y16_04485 [Rikenellaceae bacterium]